MNLDKQETKNIRVMLVLEIIGKPPEYLIEALEDLIKRIDAEKGVRVINKEIKEPKEIEGQKKGFYTTFAEIEVEVEEIAHLAILLFKYMPAHVEIIEPELIALTNGGWNDIFNELARRLHGYDEIARVLQVEKKVLEDKLRELLGKKEKDISELEED